MMISRCAICAYVLHKSADTCLLSCLVFVCLTQRQAKNVELAPAPISREQQSFTLTDFEVLTTLGSTIMHTAAVIVLFLNRNRYVRPCSSREAARFEPVFCVEDPQKVRNHSTEASGTHQVRNHAAQDDSAPICSEPVS